MFSSYSDSKLEDSLKICRATKYKGWQFTLTTLKFGDLWDSNPLYYYLPQKGLWTWLSQYDEEMLVGQLAQDLQQCQCH